MNEYRAFRYNVSKYSKNIKCPLCNHKTLKLSDFENHCENDHDLDPTVLCVFCRQFCWSRGQKVPNGPHLYECLKRFIDRNNVSVAYLQRVEPTTSTMTPPETICPCASFNSNDLRRRTDQIPEWSESDISEGGVHLMYEPLLTVNEFDDWYELPEFGTLVASARLGDGASIALLNTVKFHPSTGLDEAVKWIQRYIYHEKRFGWYHVCVRAGCMKSFVRVLRDLQIVELPYWCVCKGRGEIGSSPENVPTWKHHRHTILLVRNKNAFKKSLEKNIVYATGLVPENGKRYYCNEIKNVNHFVSTIAYVSTSRSNCKCDETVSENLPVKTLVTGEVVPRHSIDGSHYYIEKPVIPHAVIWMLLVVPGEALERYCKFRIGSRSVLKMQSKVYINSKWYVSACEELGVRNCVVLFEPFNSRIGDVVPLDEVLPYATNYLSFNRRFIYWFKGTVLKVTQFDEGPDNLEDFRNYCFENKYNTMLNTHKSFFPLLARGQRQANDLCTLENNLKNQYASQIQQLESEKEKTQIKYNRLEIKLRDEYDKQIKELNETIKQLNSKLDTEKTERIKELKFCLNEERRNKRKLENKLKTFKNKFEKCLSEIEALKTSTKNIKRESKDYKKKLQVSEAKLEAFRVEKYLPLQRDLNNALRREKRFRTKM